MNCCSCAPLAVETIYNKVEELEKKGLISPTICATTRSKLLEFTSRSSASRIGAKNSESETRLPKIAFAKSPERTPSAFLRWHRLP